MEGKGGEKWKEENKDKKKAKVIEGKLGKCGRGERSRGLGRMNGERQARMRCGELGKCARGKNKET